MKQDWLNKIKADKNSKYLWGVVGVGIGFLISVCWRIFLIFLVCAVSIVVFVCSSKIIDKFYRKRIEEKDNRLDFDYMQEFNIYKKMRKQNAEDGVLNYSAWKARIQKNYGKQKANEDFCHYLIQKKRDIESARKDEVGISLTLTVAAAAWFFEDNYAKVQNLAVTGFVIFTMILSITVLVATTNYRLRIETEFLEDVMQVLEDKEQNEYIASEG